MAVGRAPGKSAAARAGRKRPTGPPSSDADPCASQLHAVSGDGGPHAVAQPQLGQDPTGIAPDRGRLEDEAPGDLRVGQPVRDEPDDVRLARRERVDRPPGALPLAGGQAPRHPALEDLPGRTGRGVRTASPPATARIARWSSAVRTTAGRARVPRNRVHRNRGRGSGGGPWAGLLPVGAPPGAARSRPRRAVRAPALQSRDAIVITGWQGGPVPGAGGSGARTSDASSRQVRRRAAWMLAPGVNRRGLAPGVSRSGRAARVPARRSRRSRRRRTPGRAPAPPPRPPRAPGGPAVRRPTAATPAPPGCPPRAG